MPRFSTLKSDSFIGVSDSLDYLGIKFIEPTHAFGQKRVNTSEYIQSKCQIATTCHGISYNVMGNKG